MRNTVLYFLATLGSFALAACGGSAGDGANGPLGETAEAVPSRISDSRAASDAPDGSDSRAASDASECISCAELVDSRADPRRLCGRAKIFYDALEKCACSGACASKCATSFCVDRSQDEWCYQCLDFLHGGCGPALAACYAH